MANGFELDETPSSLADGRVVDAEPGVDAPRPVESPEDVVRRLMEAEAGGHSPPAPAFRASEGHDTAPGKTPDRPGGFKRLVHRLTAAPTRVITNMYTKPRKAVLAYRPTPRHMALVLVAVIALTMPWLIPVLLLLGLIIVVVSYLSLGHDRAAELVVGWYGWLARRNPQGAEQLRAHAERASARLTIWAGYLPQSWTNGLYLPEFTLPDEVPDKLAGDPFERLAGDPQNR